MAEGAGVCVFAFFYNALQGDVKYAQVEFGEDGNPISIDMFEDGKICRRNYYDDRGFVSSTVIYENGIEQYQDFFDGKRHLEDT